jgi:beta-xylosidase
MSQDQEMTRKQCRTMQRWEKAYRVVRAQEEPAYRALVERATKDRAEGDDVRFVGHVADQPQERSGSSEWADVWGWIDAAVNSDRQMVNGQLVDGFGEHDFEEIAKSSWMQARLERLIRDSRAGWSDQAATDPIPPPDGMDL